MGPGYVVLVQVPDAEGGTMLRTCRCTFTDQGEALQHALEKVVTRATPLALVAQVTTAISFTPVSAAAGVDPLPPAPPTGPGGN